MKRFKNKKKKEKEKTFDRSSHPLFRNLKPSRIEQKFNYKIKYKNNLLNKATHINTNKSRKTKIDSEVNHFHKNNSQLTKKKKKKSINVSMHYLLN